MGYRTCTGLVSICLFLATAAAVVAFFVDFWGEIKFASTFGYGGHLGLWRICPEKIIKQKCTWIYKDLGDLDRIRDIPGMLLSVHILI